MSSNVISRAMCSVYDYEFMNQFFSDKLRLRDVSQKTIDIYTRNVAQIALFFNINPLELTSAQMDEYLIFLKKTRSGPTAFRHAIYSLRALFDVYDKKALKNKLPKISLPQRIPVVLSTSECRNLIMAPDSMKERFLIAFSYSSGLRVGEISCLRLEDVDCKRMQIRVVQGKGKKDRYVPLSRMIALKMDTYLEKYQPLTFLFNCNIKGRALAVRGIQRIIRQAVLKSGMIKKVTAHTLRHTYATHLVELGVDLVSIKNVLGHKNIQTTMQYLHIAGVNQSVFKNPLDVLFNF